MEVKWINRGSPYNLDKESIEYVEKYYNATWVGAFCLNNKQGGWTTTPVDVFYQPAPVRPEYSNYFSLFLSFVEHKLMICDAKSIEDQIIEGVCTSSGEVIYSRYCHDFRQALTADISIDGGRDYTRLVGDDIHNSKRVQVTVKSGKLLVDGKEYPCEPQSTDKLA